MSTRDHRGNGIPPSRPLRVATHNMGGLRIQEGHAFERIETAVRVWADQRLDVVCLQETHHINAEDHTRLQQALRNASARRHLPGWAIAAFSWSSAGPSTAGVAILVRADLASVASIQHQPLPEGVPSGWFTACQLQWGGHRLQICSTYFPQTSRPDATSLRKTICERCLHPTASQAAAANALLLWCGDFNFVEHPTLDCSAGAGGRPGDAATTQIFQAAAAPTGMVDCFRTLHPQRHEYTHMYRAPTHGGSRIDRIYAPIAALPYLIGATIHVDTPSDHRIATIHLSPRPVLYGPSNPTRRLRLSFITHPDLKNSFRDWAEEQAASAPIGEEHTPQAILQWWSGFKRRVTARATTLNQEAEARRLRPSARVRQLQTAAKEAAAALAAAPGDHGRLVEAVEAQVVVSAAMRADARTDVIAARRANIADGERPSTALTALVHDTGPNGDCGPGPTALRDPSTGQLTRDPVKLAQVIADYWRDVSAIQPETELPPTVKLEAQTAVLEAVRAQPLRLPEDPEDHVGRPEVASAEVARALRTAPNGKAPGWDGLPAELFKAFSQQFSPVLAALYTAIGTTGSMPPRFTDGIIKVLFKKGDPTQPGNYRPITLLNTDYRILAKVLALRLGPALNAAIAAVQTAFLPERLIGCNILTLRQLPHLLRRQNRSAIIAFLDFAKAYDTVHRDFLLAAMTELGASEQLRKWVHTLLAETRAQAMVGGHLSTPVSMAAGVRQGCPLAPLLYLFVAQALLSWLQRKGIGIRLTPESDTDQLTAVQFADDGQVLLEGESAVPTFLEAMQTFAQAAGQRLNLDKVELLKVGVEQPQQPPQPLAAPQPGQQQHQPQPELAAPLVSGLRLVPGATALGIQFTNAVQLAPASGQNRALTTTKQRLHRLSILPLSVFGRCAGVSSYALQLRTYHWEHGGLPSGTVTAEIEGWAAAVCDRQVSPQAPSQRLTGIPKKLLYGHPTAGGFGLLPLQAHVRAREAVWAARFARLACTQDHSTNPHPWARILWLHLRTYHCLLSPSSVLTAAIGTSGPHGSDLPQELSRIITALGHLPPVQDVAPEPLQAPGDWCFNIPLWGNPLLPNVEVSNNTEDAEQPDREEDGADPDFEIEDNPQAGGGADAPRPGLDCRHARLATCGALRTVGDAVRVGRAAEGHASALRGVAWQHWVETELQPPDARSFRQQPTLRAIRSLLADIGADWRAAASAVLERANGNAMAAQAALAAAGEPSEDNLRALIVERMGWRFNGSLTVPLKCLTVGLATQLQLRPVAEMRIRLHADFALEARHSQPLAPPAQADQTQVRDAAAGVQATLARLWKIKWERENKETLWRLAVDGIPLRGNTHLHGLQPERCGCGGYGGPGPQPTSPRAHHFWGCPVAQAVVQQISAHVPSPVSQAHVWLVEAPAGIQQCVWDIVAPAALTAMEKARVGLRAASNHTTGGAAGQATATASAQGIPPPVEVAKARAVLEFWQRIRSFAALGVPRKGWDGVGPDHPILSVHEGHLTAAMPADIEGLEADGWEG